VDQLNKVKSSNEGLNYSKKEVYRFYIMGAISFVVLILFLGAIRVTFKDGVGSLDQEVINFVNGIRNENYTRLFTFLTYIGNPSSMIMITLITALALDRYYEKKSGRFFICNILYVWILNTFIKYMVKRPRPFVTRLVEAKGYSFPSAHAMVSMAATLLGVYFIFKAVQNKKRKYIFSMSLALLGILIGISRAYLGVHYLTDIIAGWGISIIWCIMSVQLYELKKSKNKEGVRSY
jgi:undecaprenyl-diphosphatase